ncbi:bifunctional phosphopantothenoylcysteine decarboxylase/phosphopantothenate--cysteine ligase CoaBC, partial [Kingella kingae]|nr:bifunctional phosphopantothenoylcysteine decarboxylase/phosphopantothenate--cysteine ligase CoaBC [Kingella kingae]
MSRHILLAITGSIAAYKSCELVRLLKKQEHEVTVAMSEAACTFVTPQTFQALSGNPVLTAQGGAGNGMAHINATRAADIMLIAPASANTIAKIAHGIADNIITEMAAARNCPLVLAPAMNVEMWQNPANLRNIKQLQADGVYIMQPAHGEQACGEVGMGRMLEAAEIADLLPDFWSPKPLLHKKIVITVGATYEAIDPVRGITNISSGQMGVALARACRRVGASVVLIHGKMQAALPVGMAHTQEAISAKAMYDAVLEHLP